MQANGLFGSTCCAILANILLESNCISWEPSFYIPDVFYHLKRTYVCVITIVCKQMFDY